MSLTRFYDDDARVKKQLEESLNVGLYHLDTPGNGLKMPFLEDPQIRLQGWGANIRTNTIELSNDLLGINRKLRRDKLEYNSKTPITHELMYGKEKAYISETRTTHPAWMFRENKPDRWFHSFHNVQANTEIPFENNASTRILEKDNFVREMPEINNKKQM